MTKLTLLSRAVAQVTAALGACLLACACPAAAFTPSSKFGGENTPLDLKPSSTAPHATSSGGASLVRTIVGLAIVIAVIWGLAWILRQVKAGREGGRDAHQSSDGLASVAALTLGTGRSVHLVRAGNDYVLLGSTEHGVAPIHRYTEEQAREAGLLLPDAAPERSTASATRPIREPHRPGRGRVARSGSRLASAASQIVEGSPVVGRRPDPMRMPSPSSGVIERLREWTVRR